MLETVAAIAQKHKDYGITVNPPASLSEIQRFEAQLGFELPADFKTFYSICNGFECTDDLFKIVTLSEALQCNQDYGSNWYYFAEYMIYSDMWSLHKQNNGRFEIINKGETDLILTTSLLEFLQRFLKGGIFEKGGLYQWHSERKPG